jgi:hypothetical protein
METKIAIRKQEKKVTWEALVSIDEKSGLKVQIGLN